VHNLSAGISYNELLYAISAVAMQRVSRVSSGAQVYIISAFWLKRAVLTLPF